MGNKKFECSAVTYGCEIEFTNFCGLDCIGCVRKQARSFGFLDLSTLKKIISFVKEQGYTEIVISGLGDAFLHKEFYSFIDYIFGEIPDIFIYIMTKGQSVSQKDIELFSQYKKENKNLNITFSIFSLDEKEYKITTGGGNLQRLLKNIIYARKKNINFGFEFLLDIKNVSQIPRYKKFCTLFGKDFYYSIPHNWGGVLDGKVYEDMFHQTELIKFLEERKKGDTCEAFGGNFVFFDYTGGVYKCGLKRFSNDLYLGNISRSEFVFEKDSLDYNTCKTCSYYRYKTKIG